MDGLGINIPNEMRFYPYFAVFDFEVYFKYDIDPSSATTQYIAEHIPISVAICSNVPGFEHPKCIVSENSDQLVSKMVDYLEEMRMKARLILHQKFDHAFSFLSSEIALIKKILPDKKEGKDDEEEMEDETGFSGNFEAMETDENEPVSQEFIDAMKKENTFRKFLENICESSSEDISEKGQENGESDISNGGYLSEIDQENYNSENEDGESCKSEGCSFCFREESDDCSKQSMFVETESDPENTGAMDYLEFSPAELEALKVNLKLLTKLQKDLTKFCDELPILGFNSARYDLNLIKTKMIRVLKQRQSKNKDSFIVKRNNSYVCISLNCFKFLDVSQYLAPGFSYSAFLKAYDCTQRKGFFPYEWFDCPEKLHNSAIPTHSDFFSLLRNGNISEAEYLFCQEIWKEKKMQTFEDFLRWYNILDVEPFVEAVEKMIGFYRTYKIDLLKETLSVPGVARKIIFKSIENKAHFALPSKNSQIFIHASKII